MMLVFVVDLLKKNSPLSKVMINEPLENWTLAATDMWRGSGKVNLQNVGLAANCCYTR
jgi:hypothetical protein